MVSSGYARESTPDQSLDRQRDAGGQVDLLDHRRGGGHAARAADRLYPVRSRRSACPWASWWPAPDVHPSAAEGSAEAIRAKGDDHGADRKGDRIKPQHRLSVPDGGEVSVPGWFASPTPSR